MSNNTMSFSEAKVAINTAVTKVETMLPKKVLKSLPLGSEDLNALDKETKNLVYLHQAGIRFLNDLERVKGQKGNLRLFLFEEYPSIGNRIKRLFVKGNTFTKRESMNYIGNLRQLFFLTYSNRKAHKVIMGTLRTYKSKASKSVVRNGFNLRWEVK